MSKSRRIYIAGPMTGLPVFNFPAFHDAAARLRKAGWDVVNPAENFDGRTDLSREYYLRTDVRLLTECDAIAMLRGWEESRGARLEHLLARELGLKLLNAKTLQPLEE
jgi:nucleoside 2-deoxyribosyltransferase